MQVVAADWLPSLNSSNYGTEYRQILFNQLVSILNTAFIEPVSPTSSGNLTLKFEQHPGVQETSNFSEFFFSNSNYIYNASNDNYTKDNEMDPDEVYSPAAKILMIIAGTLLSIVTAGGNLLVMLSFKIDKRLQTISNYFLLSLAVADFSIGLISCPFMTIYTVHGKWRLGYVACQFWLCLDYLMSNASVWNLLLISLDRYFSVTRPLTYRPHRTTQKALIMISATYFLSLILWPPWIVAWPYIDGRFAAENRCEVQFLGTNAPVTIGTIMVAFYIPVTIMVLLYARVYYETKKRQREVKKLQGFQNSRRKPISSNSINGRHPSTCRYSSLEPRGSPEHQQCGRVPFQPLKLLAYVRNHRRSRSRTSRYIADNNDGGNISINGAEASSISEERKDSTSVTALDKRAAARAGLSRNPCQTQLMPLLRLHYRVYELSLRDHERENAVSKGEAMAMPREIENSTLPTTTTTTTIIGNSAVKEANSVIKDEQEKNDVFKKSITGSNGMISDTYTVLIQLEPNHHTSNPNSENENTTALGPQIFLDESDNEEASLLSPLSTPRQLTANAVKSDPGSVLVLNSSHHAKELDPFGPTKKATKFLGNNCPIDSEMSSYSHSTPSVLPRDRSGTPRKIMVPTKEIPTKRKCQERKSQESKAAKTLSAILLAFILTWAPYSIIVVIEVFWTGTTPEVWYTFSYYLCYINSTVNPLCYALCNANFRSTYLRILKCQWHQPKPAGRCGVVGQIFVKQ